MVVVVVVVPGFHWVVCSVPSRMHSSGQARSYVVDKGLCGEVEKEDVCQFQVANLKNLHPVNGLATPCCDIRCDFLECRAHGQLCQLQLDSLRLFSGR